jgi:hypothetical protein
MNRTAGSFCDSARSRAKSASDQRFGKDTHTLLLAGPVCALPSWSRARLLIPSVSCRDRWRKSAMYPGTRAFAKVFRLAIRAIAAAGMLPVKQGRGGTRIHEFVADVLPAFHCAVVLIGTRGPAQKLIIQLWDRSGSVIGYLKYGESPAARMRLRNEFDILRSLACGPSVLKFGTLGNGDGLVLTPVLGHSAQASLPASPAVERLKKAHFRFEQAAIAVHPLVLRNEFAPGFPLQECLDNLSRRPWPVGLMHGDFTPWNIVEGDDGQATAIDWENGCPDGIPYLDLAHFALQVAGCVYKWQPDRALEYGTKYLAGLHWANITLSEARWLLLLSASFAYEQAARDGMSPLASVQCWRKSLWDPTVRVTYCARNRRWKTSIQAQ